ncbi:unnamed protein product [Coregonus sp. 'balchen']|nr:unnamed protein product [Coregonus sp. 'balchen']
MCVPCEKRIRFGKMAVKCRDCFVVAHPECKQKCLDCSSASASCGAHGSEKGIYRVPGCERMVKELRKRYINGKGPLMPRVDEIHVVCGLLKDFLRKLKEPLITFRLHRTFMEACEITDDDNSTAIIYQAIADLPKPKRNTLAFLMLHLQRVFGPTILGHGMAEPFPMTIMRETNTQPKYWKRHLMVERDQVISSVVDANISHSIDRDRLFKPLISPELSKYPKTPSCGSLKGIMKNGFNLQ